VPPEFRSEFRQITATVDPARYVGDAAPAFLLFQDGRRDEIVSQDELRGLYAVASEPKELRWYDAGHVLNAKAVDDQLEWLARRLR
jgi:surfactin synthase thioesterase subunit